MKLSEAKEIYKGVNYCDLKIEYSPIPFIKKVEIIKAILLQSINIENNVKVIDNFLFELLSKLYIFGAYTGIEYDEGMSNEEIYDYLISSDLYKDFENDVYDFYDYHIFDDLLDIEKDSELENFNSLESVVSRGLNVLLEKIPNSKMIAKMIKDVPRQINKISPENLSVIKDIFSQKSFQDDVKLTNK